MKIILLLLTSVAQATTLSVPRQYTASVFNQIKAAGATNIYVQQPSTDPLMTTFQWVEPAAGPVTVTGVPDVSGLKTELRAIVVKIRNGTNTSADNNRALLILILLNALD